MTTTDTELQVATLSSLIDECIKDRENHEARANLREFGLRLHGSGGTALMYSVMQTAAGDGPDYERRVDLCDKCWHGIGEWVA